MPRQFSFQQSGIALTLTACLLLTSCAGNPFTPDDRDYARKMAISRLREIQAEPLDSHRKPADSTTTTTDINVVRKRFEGLAQTELSLEDCRASALQNNLNLKVALVDPTIARQAVSREEAKFESAFTLQTAWINRDKPTASTLVSNQSDTEQVVPGVRIPLRTGGNVEVRMPIARSGNDNPFTTLDPAYSSELEFSISHELLRNAGRRAQTAQLRINGYNEQAVGTQTRLSVIRSLADVDRSYWRLYQARRELDVRQQQYELAVVQLERARRRFNAGQSPELDVVQAEAGLADRLETIILAQNAILVQQRALKRAVNLPGLDIDTKTQLVPKTQPDPVEYVFDQGRLLSDAVSNRSEMLELELRLAADAASIGLARNQMLPQFTLGYTYRFNGLGGSMQDNFKTLYGNDYEDWEVTLNAQVPLGNEAAKSQLRQAILTRVQRLSTKDAREQQIREEVLNSVDTIDAGWQRILAARQSVILNTRALQAQQRQFDVGRATTTDVLDAATKLADAQSSEISALTNYQIAQVDLAFATGTLLGAAKIAWEPAAEPDLKSADPKETLPSSDVTPSPNAATAPN